MNSRIFRVVLIGLSTLSYINHHSCLAQAQNWPEFRGPTGDGQTHGSTLPLVWSEDENIKWKTPIHGMGWSSPVVWGDQIWLTTATEDGKKMYAICVNRHTGQIVHDLLLIENENPRFRHPTNSYASPTPVIEEGRVYVHFGSYGTICLDTQTGQEIWRRDDLECDHWRAPGSSPILDGDRLIVAYDGFDLQYVVALDKNDGKTIWKKDRNIDYGTDNGDFMKAYSTAKVYESAGKRQVVSPAAVESIAYDVETGDELWRVRHGWMNAAIRPLYDDGLVFIAAGKAKMGLIAVRTDGSGDVTESHIEWTYGPSPPERSGPLLIDGLLYFVSDKGVASCIEAKTGETVWQSRLGGAYRASPIYADGKIYFCSEEGLTSVIEAGREFKLLQQNQLEDGFQASPAVVGNTLYLRTLTHLYCVE